ncbi:unnamed protein product [Notodromas monacha]|uniref:Uncharacterized protein n=1 Tax=Notodromas monacha TaxID=399045 RepID=A0A7R9BNU0_9CRUS|nr:unnamed protein product [Notodromas monacha]CAG0918618.1 unnamed protein product [Notodromas monacha]
MGKPVTASTMVLVLVVVASAFPPEAEAKKPKSVTATLDAKWAETPLLLEAAEFLWDESPAKFWGFVEDVARIEPESFLQSE